MADKTNMNAIILAATLTAASGVNAENTLAPPPLPDHASGAQCSDIDHIDRTNKDFMREKLEAVIKSGEIFEDGWKLVSRGYQIPYMQGGHHNLELLKPDGTLFASLDTQQIQRKTGEIKGYFPDGEYAAPVVDDCIPGNFVVLKNKDNMLGQTIIAEGRGTQALLGFARGAEVAAGKLSEDNNNYSVVNILSSDGVNSNSYARAFAEAAAGKDIYAQMRAYGDKPMLGSPNLKTDILSKPPTSRYDPISHTPDMIVLAKPYYDALLKDMATLHPIAQQERAMHLDAPSTTGNFHAPRN